MRILLTMVAVMVSAGLAGAADEAIQRPQALRTYSSSVQRVQPTKSAQEEACDCCRKCRAAQGDIRPSHNGVPATNGCRDCCQRCGPDSMPTDRHMIPERMRPEIR